MVRLTSAPETLVDAFCCFRSPQEIKTIENSCKNVRCDQVSGDVLGQTKETAEVPGGTIDIYICHSVP